MEYTIKIIEKPHLIEWLRFIQDSRPKGRLGRNDVCILDFRKASFLQPYHMSSLACVIEEYKQMGVRLIFKIKERTKTGKFLKYTKFDKYWNNNFNRNNCFLNLRKDILPVWQLKGEMINAFGELAQNFYNSHSLQGRDLSKLRLTVVEALNNIQDHSESKIGGFICTQYFSSRSELIISICDFGVGIAQKVNSYLKRCNEKELSHPAALSKALELGFTTKSKPNNGGLGLDNILSHVKTTDGEIQIVTNRAFCSYRIKDSVELKPITDDLSLSFNGTYLVIKLNTNKFLPIQHEEIEEMNLF